MARLTEIPDQNRGSHHAPTRSNPKQKPEILTQGEQEEILFKSGVIEKLGLPADFITLEEAQQQLEQLNKSTRQVNSNPKSKPTKPKLEASTHCASPTAQRTSPFPEWATDSEGSQDEYGQPSDDDEQYDDDAERLMSEQQDREMSTIVESSLDLIIWTMPFGFLFTLLDILVMQQYAEAITFAGQTKRLMGTLPILAIFIWYNLHSSRKVLLQFVLFAISIFCGCALIYIVNKSTYDIVVQRVAPLGTLWIFSVVRMDLLPTCVSLAIVSGFVQYANLRIIFDV